jgi:integrase
MARKRDLPTRWPCIVIRHQIFCPANEEKRCCCEPSYIARVWHPQRRRPVHSPTFRSPDAGLQWQVNTRAALRRDPAAVGAPVVRTPTAVVETPSRELVMVSEASARFIDAMKRGVALNKKGKPYKPKSLRTIEQALLGRVEDELGEVPLEEVRRGQIQTLVDEMVAENLSGSRVRNVVNALRSLYAYAIPHELAETSPIANILLPAIDEKPRTRIATPSEFHALLNALEPRDAVPFAISGYATARSQEVVNLIWPDVSFSEGMLYLAEEEHYTKTAAARRPVPLIAPLRRILKAEWERQGEPTGRQRVCPAHKPGGRNSGNLSLSGLYTRADKAWETKHLTKIRLQDCRHTAASWMRAAGLDLKTRSVVMGHSTTAVTDGGPGSITDDRYTHLLPGEIQAAGKQLTRYLNRQLKRSKKSDVPHR